MPSSSSLPVALLLLASTALGKDSGLPPNPASPPEAESQAAWVVLGPSGPVVRAVTGARTSCPSVVAVEWGSPARTLARTMEVRARPAAGDPNLVCEAVFQDWTGPGVAIVEGQSRVLRMPHPHPRRFVVLGDTGCEPNLQDCATEWPFAQIAREAAALQPDLILHVGDYNYRATGCVAYDGCCRFDPAHPTACGFPPCGDGWPSWRDDFFTPAAPLLEVAPWVMLRGNHELCSQTGRGWFRYLDPHSPPPVCQPNPVEQPTFTAPYAVSLGKDLGLVVLDSANACDVRSGARPDALAEYTRQFQTVQELAGRFPHVWFLSHHPLWAITDYTLSQEGALTASQTLNDVLQQASGNRMPPNVELLLAGHIHMFQALSFTGGRPPQLVAGNGGAGLSSGNLLQTFSGVGFPQIGDTIRSGTALYRFGFLLLERTGDGWRGTAYGTGGQVLTHCSPAGRPDLCAPTVP